MAGEDPNYLGWVARLKCCCCPAQSGPPHHTTAGRGKGQRAHDHRAIPLCHMHHDERHRLCGFFKGWVRDEIQAWEETMVARTRGLWFDGKPLFDPARHTLPHGGTYSNVLTEPMTPERMTEVFRRHDLRRDDDPDDLF